MPGRHVKARGTSWAVVELGWLVLGGSFLVAGTGEKVSDAIAFSGRVIDKANGEPVAGATVVVTRSILGMEPSEAPAWVGDTTLRTDADGRFTLTFPPEQVAESRLQVAIARVAHPDFIPRQGYPVPLAFLLRGRNRGDKPFFDTITLERGTEYVGQVVTPEGQPVPDVLCAFENWTGGTNRADHFDDDGRRRTDAEGRFRLRTSRSHALAVTVLTEEFAPFRRFWGTARMGPNCEIWVPTDLGRLVLEPGPRLTGRLLDLQGRPIAGQRLFAQDIPKRIERSATTDSEGRFTFAPLRPGNYDVFAEGQHHPPSIYPTARLMPVSAPVVRPVRVFFKKGETPAPIELRELPSVRVVIRFVDSHGRPTQGTYISLSGRIPSAADKESYSAGARSAAEINNEEPEDPDKRLHWGCQLVPDRQGGVAFRVPKGLTEAHLMAVPTEPWTTFKTRLEPNGPLMNYSLGDLGPFDGDREGITIICYRAPIVLVTVRTAEGDPVPADADVSAVYIIKGSSYGSGAGHQDDGRFRIGLLPDQEYKFAAYAKGYVPNAVERLTLPEGASAELTLTIGKKPLPLLVGDPAPGFVVKTFDGELLGLPDFRGRFMLLHFWDPYRGSYELPRLKAVRKQFEGDQRLAMLGFCLSDDLADAAQAVKEQGPDWPQAVLRDARKDSIVLEYGGYLRPKTYLIGPDGTILAKDLTGDQIEDAVAKALGRKK